MSPPSGHPLKRVLTIGAYGFNQPSFLSALKHARADLFVDIRARRGVRGREYAFANAGRLQAALAAAGINYVHVPDLAPSAATRAAQGAVDDAAGISRRQRTSLSPAFHRAYERERMRAFSPADFVRAVIKDARRPVLFCVEAEPEACHRSIVARRLAEAMSVPVEHLKPD